MAMGEVTEDTVRPVPSSNEMIRPAGPHDLDEICALIRELAVYEHLEDEVVLDPDVVAEHLFGARPVAEVAMAETADGAVAGFALWFPTFSTFLGRPGI